MDTNPQRSSAPEQSPASDVARGPVGARNPIVSAAANAVRTFEGFLAANSHHISGRDVSAAIEAARVEAARGKWLTLGYWSHSGEAPTQIAAQYMASVDAISAAGLTSSISIKVDTVEFNRELLLPLFERARARGVRLHFDSQSWGTMSRTFALLEEAREMGADVSASITARWRRSRDDVERMIALGVPMRVVKGQGGDPGARGIDPRRAFLDIVRQCAGRATHVGVATHDRRVAEPALDILKASGGSCCLEQLTSLPRLDFVAEKRELPVLLYIAYGRVGLPYAITELVRRPAIIGWIARDLYEKFRP